MPEDVKNLRKDEATLLRFHIKSESLAGRISCLFLLDRALAVCRGTVMKGTEPQEDWEILQLGTFPPFLLTFINFHR